MSLRNEVIGLYRRVMRLARSWESKDSKDTHIDRLYIRNEARTLFRQNKNIETKDVILEHLQEAEARIGIALHYKIPYPRPVNLPQNQLPPGKGKYKSRDRLVKMTKPIYIKSYDDDRNKT